jgi:hypothetical protein
MGSDNIESEVRRYVANSQGVRLGTIASYQSPMVPKISPTDIVVSFHRKALSGGERKGGRMMPDAVVLFATIIVLLPMGYFLLAAPAFLLVRLDIPPVALLLRGMFNGYFLAMITAGVIGTLAFAVAGRLVIAIGVGLIAAFEVSARRWFLRQMDAQLRARDAGDADTVRRLRRLHWGGMLCNAIQVVAIVGSIPYILVTPT